MGVRIAQVIAVAVGGEAFGRVVKGLGHVGDQVGQRQIDGMFGVGHGRPGDGGHGGGQVVIDFDHAAVDLALDADHADVGAAGVLGIPLGALEAGAGQLENVAQGDLLVGLIEQRIAGFHGVVARGGGGQQHMAIPGAAVRAGVQVALAAVGGEQIDVALLVQHGQAGFLRHGEQSLGVEQGFALDIISHGAEHTLVAEHGDAVGGHLHGDPLMSGIALQIPGLSLVGDHEGVGFGAAVRLHDLAVIFNGLARRGGDGGDIAGNPHFGRAVLGIGIGGADAVGDIGGDGAGHGHAQLIGDGVVIDALDEGGGRVLIGHVRQGNFVLAHGQGAAALFNVRIDDLLGLRGVPRVNRVADDGVAAGAGVLADIIAGAGESGAAGEGQNGDEQKRGQAFQRAIHQHTPLLYCKFAGFLLSVEGHGKRRAVSS